MDDAQNKKYTFKVAVDANKTQVKLAVEEIFGVEVAKVNIMNVTTVKLREWEDTKARLLPTRKAIVTLTEEQ